MTDDCTDRRQAGTTTHTGTGIWPPLADIMERAGMLASDAPEDAPEDGARCRRNMDSCDCGWCTPERETRPLPAAPGCQHSLRVIRSGMELCDEGCGAVLGEDPLTADERDPVTRPAQSFEALGAEIGRLVAEKQRAYGDSYGRSGEVMRVLYPDGIRPEQYDDALAVVRVVDKLFRIATDRDALGESPWRDIAGYGLLGAARAERGE